MAFPYIPKRGVHEGFSLGGPFERKDDGGDDLLPHNLHQLVYTYPGGFTCTQLKARLLLWGIYEGDGVELSRAEQDQDRLGWLYSIL